MKATLTISSFVTIALLFVAAVDENYVSEWRSHQRSFKQLLLDKAGDDAERRLAERFQIETRQIVTPDLGRVDRCVGCHLGLDDPRMKEEELPFATHPGTLLDTHDADKFGCTACHDGQGWATTKEAAHADEHQVFWERPLLPAPLNQSTCGICHDPASLAERGAPVLARGFAVFREQGCRGCHKLGGRGGPHGLPLDQVGDKVKHSFSFAHIEGEHSVWSWHREHFRNPQEVVPGSRMPAVEVNDDEIDALITYVLSLRSSNLTESLTPPDKVEERYRTLHPDPLSGAELYQQFCFTCHGEGLETIIHDILETSIPSIRNPDYLAVTSPELLTLSIREGREGSEMPAWGAQAGGLTDAEIERLASHLLEGVEPRALDFVPAATVEAANGRTLFEEFCAECHGVTRDADAWATWLGNPAFQRHFSDELMGHTIKHGREDTLMVGFGEVAGGDLSDQGISDVVAFIRTLGP